VTELDRRRQVRIGRRAALVGAAASAAAGLAACEKGPPLRIALHGWPGYEFMRLASRSGTVSASTAVVVDTTTVQESLELLARGSVDGAGLTVDQVLGARREGLDLVVALVFDVSAGADAVLALPGISGIRALRGKTIGVERSTLGEVMLTKVLEAAALERADVKVVGMDEDHVAAWDRGGLDAIITYESALGRLRARGLQQIYDSRSLPRLIVDVLGVRRGLQGQKAAALRTIVAAHLAILDEWRRSPADLSYRLATMLSSSSEEVVGSYIGLDLPDAVYNRRYLTPPAAEMLAAARELAKILGMAAPDAGIFVPDFLPDVRR
jgi:NitT/TauT family transport system substrate-binding protein